MCFGDPWEGAVPAEQVVKAGKRLLDLGCSQLSLGDTIGVATAGQVENVIGGFGATEALAVHFHDTYGQALANTLAALRCGVSTVDASAGGLGGCPFAPGASGNIATEDLVYMLRDSGIGVDVDLQAAIHAAHVARTVVGHDLPSALLRAGDRILS
jgi:hydroxymethylglutaryl-CoA lyase